MCSSDLRQLFLPADASLASLRAALASEHGVPPQQLQLWRCVGVSEDVRLNDEAGLPDAPLTESEALTSADFEDLRWFDLPAACLER